MTSEDFLLQKIKKLEEEISVLHINDKTNECILKLYEISGQAPITQQMADMGSMLSRDLFEGDRIRQNFYLRKEIDRLREENNKLHKELEVKT